MMKYLIWLTFLLPVMGSAQDCELRDEKDRLNQDPRLTTGFKAMGAGNDRFLVSISADKREIDYFFALENSGSCFDNLSRAMVFFEGGKQRSTYTNGGTMNCKGYFHFIFPNKENLPATFYNLAGKKIASIQFTGTDTNKKIITLRPEDSELIFQMTNCILQELESLRIDTWKPKQ